VQDAPNGSGFGAPVYKLVVFFKNLAIKGKIGSKPATPVKQFLLANFHPLS
jgi:hypothetical protein